MQRLFVIGGGEHARVVMEAVRSRPERFALLGFVDPQPCAETVRRLELPRLGDDREAAVLSAQGALAVLGLGAVGVSGARRAVVERLAAAGVRFCAVVHSAAWVSPTAVVDDGAVVMAGAVVQGGARLGRHSVVNSGAVIEHDADLGDFAQAGPGALVGGGTVVGAGSYLGLGCRVRDHLRIGEGTLVGMGAVVVGAVGDGQAVVGVPARPAGGGGSHG